MKTNKFILSQETYAHYVKKQNLKLYNALNVVIERTENTTLIPHWELIASCIPFVNLNNSHIGYAETQDINDIHEAWAKLQNVLFIVANVDGTVYPDFYYNVKYAVKNNQERFKQNNADYSGRILARFNYLLEKNGASLETNLESQV